MTVMTWSALALAAILMRAMKSPGQSRNSPPIRLRRCAGRGRGLRELRRGRGRGGSDEIKSENKASRGGDGGVGGGGGRGTARQSTAGAHDLRREVLVSRNISVAISHVTYFFGAAGTTRALRVGFQCFHSTALRITNAIPFQCLLAPLRSDPILPSPFPNSSVYI